MSLLFTFWISCQSKIEVPYFMCCVLPAVPQSVNMKSQGSLFINVFFFCLIFRFNKQVIWSPDIYSSNLDTLTCCAYSYKINRNLQEKCGVFSSYCNRRSHSKSQTQDATDTVAIEHASISIFSYYPTVVSYVTNSYRTCFTDQFYYT